MDNRSKLFPRVIGSLAIVGLMIGLMIGRLTTPDPSVLERVEVTDGGLVVWFNNEPKLHGEIIDGTVALLFQAEGRAQKRWRVIADGAGSAPVAGRLGWQRGR